MKKSLRLALLEGGGVATLALATGCLWAGDVRADMIFNGDQSTVYYSPTAYPVLPTISYSSGQTGSLALLPSPLPTCPTVADCKFIADLQPHYGSLNNFQLNGHTVTAVNTGSGGEFIVGGNVVAIMLPHTMSGVDVMQEQYVIPFLNATAPAITVSGTNGTSIAAINTYSGSNAALLSLASAVNSLTSAADIQKAGAQLRPEANGGNTQAALGAATQALGTVQVRADGLRAAAADQTGISSGEALMGFGLWGQGFGSYAAQDRRQDVDGYAADTYGLAFGADTPVSERVRAGLSFAYARTNVNDSGSREGSGEKINSYIGSLYGTYTANRWYVDGALTYGHHDYGSTRLVNFTGAATQTATASFSGQQYGAKAELGVPLAVGGAVVTPLVSFDYNHLAQDGYTETGAPGADLSVGSSATDSIRSGLGAKASTTIAQAGLWNIKPNLRAMWLHEFNGSAPDQTSTFVAGGTGFTTSGIQVAQEHFDVGVGLDMVSVRNTTLSAKYDADLSDRYVSHSGSLQIRAEF